jgi:hypothetical protein
MAIVVVVAGDEAFEGDGFVEEGGKEVVVVVGKAVGGGAVGGMTAVEFRAEFTGASSQS